VWETEIARSHSCRFTTIARLGDFRAAHTLNGRPRDRFRNTKDPIGKKSRSPDSQRIRPSALPGLARRQTGPPPGTAAGGMVTRLWRPDRLLARLHHPPSKENRPQSRQASIHPYRTLHRLPIRQLILHFLYLTIFLSLQYLF